ncbi:MAG TPA: DUF4198 domain-containing protein [Thermoanaerobaculia bacterium]|nr:DUF4198 domain-containing protein [Thermoanaerobaculia bacterium]
MRIPPRLCALLSLALLVPCSALAHDVWIVPASFSPVVGEPVAVRLKLGHPQQEVEPVARNPKRLLRLVALTATGEQPLIGQDGADPAGWGRFAEPGLRILVYEGSAAFMELPPDRFEHYLAEEGLDAILAERRERGETTRPGRELYSRCLKALVSVGEPSAEHDRVLGLDAELVLESDLAAPPAEPLTVRVLRRGVPLAGVLVELVRLDGRGAVQGLRSDAQGRVAFTGVASGAWLVTAVTAERSRAAEADWRSVWTSLTFERP